MSTPPIVKDSALEGVRVVDLTRGATAGLARLLSDLGASVTRVERRGGGADRETYPSVGGVSLSFLAANLGKSFVELDLHNPADRDALNRLLEDADIFIEDLAPGSTEAEALNAAAIAAARPKLVVFSVSYFGQQNSFTRWQATSPVLLSLSGLIARSGIEGRPPLLPPGDIAMQCAITQGAFVALLAYYNRLQSGGGGHLDFSLLDGASQALDPGFGMTGSASGGSTALVLPRGRPPFGRYPVIKCGDGYVRVCILAPRQWRGMWEWMGRPREFADPSFNDLIVRLESRPLLSALARFLADKSRLEVEAESLKFGVPTAALLTLEEAYESEHAVARNAFSQVTIAPGVSAPFPNGVMEIDDRRVSVSREPPQEYEIDSKNEVAPAGPTVTRPSSRPLAGLRVLDLGVIVVGAEQGRLLADQGAEVVKIESAAFPDGARQMVGGRLISANFQAGNRNKKSFGLNLRHPRGRETFLELAKRSDIILSNFKPGTMDSLGLSSAVLQEVNPRLIVVDSSAFGATGPWSRRLGYGPLVRAASGLTALWRYDDDDESFGDSATVYPDHVAARVGLIGVLALLIRRLRISRGGSLSISQSEVMLSHLAAKIAALDLEKQGFSIDGGPEHDAPWGMFPCAGDDEWCAITIRGDADWKALLAVIGRPDLDVDATLATPTGRDASRERIDLAVRRWSETRTPDDVMTQLQAAGVPAGAMRRVPELPNSRYYREREFFRTASHPEIEGDFLVEGPLVCSRSLPDPPLGPAPLMAQDTRNIASSILGLSDSEIEIMISQGVLEAAA